jgi:ABC-type antimicrobial peptide transport system permease subunit
VYPGGVFTYRFYDELLGAAYQKDEQTGILMNSAMALTIIISCIGLFGLAMFTAEIRTREIGIRKVMGASVTSIMTLLTKDIAFLIILATLIASPIAWYFMNGWLKGFADRVTIGPWIFVAGGISALFVGLATVGYQAVRAARQNPVKSLRVD